MISVWEKDTGRVVQSLPLAHAKAVLSVSISACGTTIASVGADGHVAIWDVDAGVELVSLTAAMESEPLSCAFSPCGTKLAVTESNGNVMIWSAMVGRGGGTACDIIAHASCIFRGTEVHPGLTACRLAASGL